VGSKKSKTTSTVTPAAPTWAQPAVEQGVSNLGSAYQQSQSNLGAVQPYLMQAIQNVGSGTPSYLQASNNQLESTINGSGVGANPYEASLTANPYTDQLASGKNEYIDKLLSTTAQDNPYLQQTADRIGQQTGAQLASSFGGSGRLGSGLASLLGGQGIGDALSSFYGTQYNNDQQLRASALTNAAQMQQSGLTNAAQLQQSGNQSAASLRDAELARQQQATLAAPSQYQGNLSGISSLLNLANTSTTLPLQSAGAYSSGLSGLISPYTSTTGTSTTKTTPGLFDWLQMFGQNAGSIAGAGG